MWINYALAEEIGDPELFVGRAQEMARLMKWAEGTKRRISLSTGILSRRKKGKTALLQRFFNILYTRNDPQLIPFYYRIPEERLRKTPFAELFYRRVLTQYFAFTTRTPELVAQVLPLDDLRELARSDRHVASDLRAMEDILERFPDQAWGHARDAGYRISQLNDVRIIQILDEFQYMNKFIVADEDGVRVEDLCYSYMGTAESKFSPQLVAGSYIGWLGAILRHMVGRYHEWHLDGLSDEEALEAVYNYAATYEVPITDATAPYIAEVCENDPFYIASTIRNHPEEKDLTTDEGVRDALAYETVIGQGDIARVWHEYLLDAFARVNDTNARKVVLYLAKHEPEERGRDEILRDLKLDMSDQDLEIRLHKLVKADILAEGSSNFHYKGLGDRIFAMVFRRIYGVEIERVDSEDILDEFKKELASAKGGISRHKGLAAEYKVRYRLLVASLRSAPLMDLVRGEAPALAGITLERFQVIRKAHFHLDQEKSVEADLHAVAEGEDGVDLVVEVKDWRREVDLEAIRRFISVKEVLADRLTKKTIFLFYSESGVEGEGAKLLAEAGILILDVGKLGAYETL